MTRDSELRYTRTEDRGHGRMGAVSAALLVAGCLLQVHPLQHCSTAALQHVFTMGKLAAELMFALLVTLHIT